MDRRRFLRSAAVGAAVAGVALTAYEFGASQTTLGPSSILTKTITATAVGPPSTQTVTTTQTVTSTQMVTTGLAELELFADWHGDGTKQIDEPAITDAVMELKEGSKSEAVHADSDGRYRFKVTRGVKYKLSFSDLGKVPYRFLSFSNAHFGSVANGYEFVADSTEPRISIGLMIGPLTLPFPRDARPVYEPYYVDLDPGPGMRDWRGGTRVGHDNHLGTDYIVPEGRTVVAPAPGTVIEAEGNWPEVPKDPDLGLWDDGNRITINHGRVSPYNGDFYTVYCHLKKIDCAVGQQVSRGEKIAESGNTGYKSGGPHLHFQCGGFGPRRVDPYRDLEDPRSVCYWTKDNDPQYPIP